MNPSLSSISVLCFSFNDRKEYALVEQKMRKGVTTFYVTFFTTELYILFMAPLPLKETRKRVYRNKEIHAVVTAVRKALFCRDLRSYSS